MLHDKKRDRFLFKHCHRKALFRDYSVKSDNFANFTRCSNASAYQPGWSRPCVRLYLCLSNAWIVTKRKKLLPKFLRHKKGQSFQFCDKKNDLWWGTSPCTWNFGPNWSRSSKVTDFQSIFSRGASVITPSDKKFTNRKSTTRFPMSQKWTSYLFKTPKGGLKIKTAIFRLKLHSLAYLSVQKWLVRDVPFYAKIWLKLTHLASITPIFNRF